MAKDPAFLFYPGDWLGGTLTFSRSHKGAYMDLLMAQHNVGHMALQDIRTILGEDFDSMWESKLKSKFKMDSEGKFFNEKLENESIKRKNFTEGRKKNLRQNPSHMGVHMQPHMENINGNGFEKDKGVQGEKENQVEPDHHYLQKIKSEFPVLLKMKQPLTNREAERLESEIGDERVFDLFSRMANYSKILSGNNTSTNLTLRNWNRKDNEKIITNGKSDTGNKERVAGRLSKGDLDKIDNSRIFPV